VKTIKLPYKTDNNDNNITTLLKQYSNVVRYSYKRFCKDNCTEKDIRTLSKNLNNIKLLNSWLIQCAIREAKGLSKRFNDDNNIIFGGKKNFKNLVTNKISKEEYKNNRLLPISIQGECLKQGNRSFKLDIINNNSIIFKLSKNKHITLFLPSLRNNIRKELSKLEVLNNKKQNEKGYTYSIKLTKDFIYISYEEFKEEKVIFYNKNRYIGIDLNPENIGISIKEGDKILYVREYSLKSIFDKILDKNVKLSSSDKKVKYLQNKLRFETFEISKSISELAKHYKCKNVFIEKLNFKNNKFNKYNKLGNRKNKNLWKKESFIHNLEKRLNIFNISLKQINPAYSSLIGNVIYDYSDPINASLEIGRRGYECLEKKKKDNFYPIFNKNSLKHQWKEMVNEIKNWKELYQCLKNTKMRYRVSIEEAILLHPSYSFFSLKHYKSMVNNYVFYK